VARRWQCLEVGCDAVVTAASDEELVEAANAHVREAHDSYELEEVILAAAEDDASRNEAKDGSDR
jgi:predicted small metal-binding protein